MKILWITVLLNYLLTQISTEDKIEKKHEEIKWGGNYDFIVIGSGAAGSVLARRLAEVPYWRVLLLEAGGFPGLLTRIPTFATISQLSQENWNYFSEPQNDTFRGLNDGLMRWSSGKVLGGSTAISYMIYSRGNPEDFDEWENMGYSGWGYDEVLPYFLKSEGANLEFSEEEFHNRNGSLSVEYPGSMESSISFLEAAKELDYNFCDYNGNSQDCFSPIQATLKNGGRYTVADAFLQDPPQNLEIVLNARATRVNIDAEKKRAKAVKFTKSGKKFRAVANKEIIVCAGAFNTPQILMLSGVGPQSHLEELGIKVIEDLPVGIGLVDHVVFPGLHFVSHYSKSHIGVLLDYIVQIPMWYMNGKGVLSSLAGFESIGFVKTSKNSKKPDAELLFHSSMLMESIRETFNINEEVFTSLYDPTSDGSKSIFVTLLHPKSRGTVKLRSKNPQDPPLLNPNFFAHPEDMKTMVSAIRLALDFGKSREFKNTGTISNPHQISGCEAYTTESYEYWECAVRSIAIGAYDQSGTCKMGSVVEASSLKVKGIENLRVVDASIVPTTVSGRLAATVVMIAEKVADVIKEDYDEM